MHGTMNARLQAEAMVNSEGGPEIENYVEERQNGTNGASPAWWGGGLHDKRSSHTYRKVSIFKHVRKL